MHDLHRVLERLDRQGQVIENLVLILKPCGHLVLELLSQDQELSESLFLERLNVFVLAVKLAQSVVFEFAKRQALVGTLSVDTLVQSIFSIINSLHDVLLALDSRFDLSVEPILQLYPKSISHTEKHLLVRRSWVSAMVASDSVTRSLISL